MPERPIAALVGALLLAATAWAGEPLALDGLRFTGETGEVGKGEHHADTITFKDGQFRSLDCEEWGFGPAPYQVSQVGDEIHFNATLHSPKRGRLEWQGVVSGDTASAQFRWLHKRWYWNIDREYWFRGTRDNER